MDNLKGKIKNLPTLPGVYIMKDIQGSVIYVGKAKSLKNRVSQYFQKSAKLEKVENMVSKIFDFDYFVVASEYDALALENNLIKKYQPFYNILLKDNKTFQYIKIDMTKDFPRFELVRKLTKNGKYFGPYFAGVRAGEILNIINYAYPLIKCSLNIKENSKEIKPCLYYDMHLCSAPCSKKISKNDYHKIILDAIKFLKGDTSHIESILKEKMQKASDSQNFESAMKMRDGLKMLSRLSEKVLTQLPHDINFDVFNYFRAGSKLSMCVMIVRAGKLVGLTCYFVNDFFENDSALFAQFLAQYYDLNAYNCDNVILPIEIESGILGELIKNKYQKSFRYTVSIKGAKKSLLNMAEINAKLHLEKNLTEESKVELKTTGALRELQKVLALKKYPKRIECFDISNTFGTYTVASMSVLINGEKAAGHYRKFKINSVEFIDDFASMREVLRRRFENLQSDDISFSSQPDLILIDGGKGQLSAAVGIKNQYKVDADIASLAKRLEEVFVPHFENSVILPKGNFALRVLQLARDEAHRTAITFNRQLRDKNAYKGGLTAIKGVGKAVRRILLAEFKTIENIKSASLETLQNVQGINKQTAKNIYIHFHNEI